MGSNLGGAGASFCAEGSVTIPAATRFLNNWDTPEAEGACKGGGAGADAELLFMSEVRIDERGPVGYEGKTLDLKLAGKDKRLGGRDTR